MPRRDILCFVIPAKAGIQAIFPFAVPSVVAAQALSTGDSAS
jgi:hypothetical protein